MQTVDCVLSVGRPGQAPSDHKQHMVTDSGSLYSQPDHSQPRVRPVNIPEEFLDGESRTRSPLVLYRHERLRSRVTHEDVITVSPPLPDLRWDCFSQ